MAPNRKALDRIGRLVSETSVVFVLGLMAGGLALIGAVLSKATDLRAFLFGVGASIVASATFFLFQDLATSRRTDEAIEELMQRSTNAFRDTTSQAVVDAVAPVALGFGRLESRLDDGLRALLLDRELYFPSSVYLPSDAPNPDYNSDLTSDLQKSRSFLFWGQTGRFPAQRIADMRQGSNSDQKQIRLILLAPTSRTIRARAERMIRTHGYGTSLADAMRDSALEILVGLGGLFAVRDLADISIQFVERTRAIRLEMFEDVTYLSALGYSRPGRPDAAFIYPLSLRFASGSLMDHVSRRDFELQWQDAPSLRMPSGLREEECESLLEERLGLTNVCRAVGVDRPSLAELSRIFASDFSASGD